MKGSARPPTLASKTTFSPTIESRLISVSMFSVEGRSIMKASLGMAWLTSCSGALPEPPSPQPWVMANVRAENASRVIVWIFMRFMIGFL